MLELPRTILTYYNTFLASDKKMLLRPPLYLLSACRLARDGLTSSLLHTGYSTSRSRPLVHSWKSLSTNLVSIGSDKESCWVECHFKEGVHTQLVDLGRKRQRFSAISGVNSFVPSPLATMQSVRITCTGDIADALMEALLCFGAASCTVEDSNLGAPQEQEEYRFNVAKRCSYLNYKVVKLQCGHDKIYSNGPVPWQPGKRHLWKESCITALFPMGDDVGEALAMAANSVGLKEMPLYEVEDILDQDWVQQVESQFKPIEVSQGLWIVPKWNSPPDPKALNVMIDPGLAFGTGEHPTTRLCLQWLHHVVGRGDSILDYGTGSGILSIAALKMGAASAVGVDIDPVAISSAEYNASLNNLVPNTLQVFVASAEGEDPVPKEHKDFNVVAANILLTPLVELSSRITGYCKPGGLVGVSGILVEQVAQVKEAYSPYLEGMAVSYDNGWACVSGRKKMVIQTTSP